MMQRCRTSARARASDPRRSGAAVGPAEEALVPSNSQQSKRDETAEGELLIDGEDTGPWQALSELVQVARHEKRATVVNDSLNEEGAKLGDRPLAAVLQLWAADSLVYESRFAEAA